MGFLLHSQHLVGVSQELRVDCILIWFWHGADLSVSQALLWRTADSEIIFTTIAGMPLLHLHDGALQGNEYALYSLSSLVTPRRYADNPAESSVELTYVRPTTVNLPPRLV